ncbi:MAG: hypothetical protein HYU57_05520 [Micavibrio aeruginosavorus]|nr:hypothetical protein [Micavibrio aeruginosavorus]
MIPDNGDSDPDLLPGVQDDARPEDDIGDDDIADDEEDEGEDGDGDGPMTLALNTPEPAQALQAADPLKKGKGDPKAKKGAKVRAAKTESAEGRAIDVTLSDAALGLAEPEDAKGDDPEQEQQQQEMSAFDRDEITDPEVDADKIELMSMLAGGREKPWENEKLSVVERMMLGEGYDRNTEALEKEQAEEGDPKAKGKSGPAKAAAVAAVAVAAGAAGVVAAGIKAAAAEEKKPGLAGVSRGPQRATDQDRQPVRNDTGRVPENRTQNNVVMTAQARQSAGDASLRRVGPGLAASIGGPEARGAKGQIQDGKDLLTDMLDDLVSDPDSPGMLQMSPFANTSDPDQSLQQAMNLIYASLGTDALMNVSPYRMAGWDEKRLEQKENSADVTVAPAPETSAPDPELDYRRDMQINLGPGGM